MNWSAYASIRLLKGQRQEPSRLVTDKLDSAPQEHLETEH